MSGWWAMKVRAWKQKRCLHVWQPDPPGWKCAHCDTPAPPHAFGTLGYVGEGES